MARKSTKRPVKKTKRPKAKKPITLYYWSTPNGHKISIMLEELGVPYEAHPVNINKGEQFAPAFLKISPNNRIPAIVDPDGPGGRPISVFESGAILQYLGRKFGRFTSCEPVGFGSNDTQNILVYCVCAGGCYENENLCHDEPE